MSLNRGPWMPMKLYTDQVPSPLSTDVTALFEMGWGSGGNRPCKDDFRWAVSWQRQKQRGPTGRFAGCQSQLAQVRPLAASTTTYPP